MHALCNRFEAGTDTTAAALSTFVLAAIAYPDTFKAAQAEVDRVCGEHSPTMDEFEQCEYVRAMCKEVLRWRTVTAGGAFCRVSRVEELGVVFDPEYNWCISRAPAYGDNNEGRLVPRDENPRRGDDYPEPLGHVFQVRLIFLFQSPDTPS